ncbi:MAG: hypothetical protein ABEI80_06265 [Haloplanus sp.]
MKEAVRLSALVIPYVALVAVCLVIAAAFTIPTVGFGTIGESGMLAAVAVGVISLVMIGRTDRRLYAALRAR